MPPAEARSTNDETLASLAAAGETDSGGEPDIGDEGTPYWWIAVQDLFKMPGRARDLVPDLTAKLRLPDDDAVLLDENLTTFDEVFTRDTNILKLSTIDENLPGDSPYRKSESDVLEIFVRINREARR